MPTRSTRPRGRTTPLWVISLFLGLTQTVVTVGVTRTDGTVQAVLAVFVVLFPVLIAGGFFAILWNRPQVFYSPGEYGNQDPLKFAEAMRYRQFNERDLFLRMEESIRSTLQSPAVVQELSENVQQADRVRAVLRDAADTTIETMRGTTLLTLDSRPLLGDDGEVSYIAYQQFDTVWTFLDYVWYTIADHDVPAYRYGDLWALRDGASGTRFLDIGRRWAHEHELEEDSRSLKAAGFVPGMTLEIIPLDGWRRRRDGR